MPDLKVMIPDKNRLVAAMARGLSNSFGGNQSVAGATDRSLAANGFLVFKIPREHRAKQFKRAITDYLAVYGAHVAP